MNENEIAAIGDAFKARVRELFGFLVTELGFEPPVDESSPQAHRLTYRSLPRDQLVEVVNAYHPVDYGFEVTLHSATGPRLLDDRNMVYYRFKEDQDHDLAYLAEGAERLRAVLR